MLIDLNLCFDDKKDSDLLTIRDDIIGDINQFFICYLLNKITFPYMMDK